MSVLAHVFESAGLTTIVLASMRPVAEKIHPPRTLYCEFPLGRPLGKPGDAEFQTDVLMRAFALLDEPTGPVIVDHPEVIESDETPMACAMPARFDPSLPPAVDESKALRKAYDRALAVRGATDVGRVITADEVPDVLGMLHLVAEGADWTESGLPRNIIGAVHDIRSYYEEAGTQLVAGVVPDGRAAEAWFYEATDAGTAVMGARRAIKDAKGPFPLWFYMAPAHR